MNEPHVRPAGSSLSGKVHPPRRRRGHVARSGLIDHLLEQEPDLVLVTAAAGYGKSTLLSEIASIGTRPHAWLTIDASHDEPAVLLGDIAFALNQIEPTDPSLSTDLWNQPSSVPRRVLHRFERMLESRRQPFTLFLDDCHAIQSPGAGDALTSVIDHLPAGSTLVIGGRSRPPMPLGRIRASHTVVELSEADLALGATDAITMFRALGVDIDAEDAKRLVDRTEGWPLAVYLAALARRNERRGTGSETGIAGDSRMMVEYFSDVILSGLEPDVASFLLHVAPLDRFSGRMCDDVLGRRGSAALLEDLHRRNMLVIALDERRQWYRLHHLLAEYLTAELERREPTAADDLRIRASEWHAANGDADESIVYAGRAGDSERTAQLVMQHVPLYNNLGRHTTIERWLGLFSDEQLRAHPVLMSSMATAAFSGGDAGAAVAWLERATATMGGGAGQSADDERAGDRRVLALARAAIAWLPMAEMEREARQAYDVLAPGATWQTFSSLLVAAAQVNLGQTDSAEEILREAIVGTEARLATHASAGAILGLLLAARGRWDEAIDTALHARSLIADRTALPGLTLVLAVGSLAQAKRGLLEPAAADHHLARAHLARYSHISPWVNTIGRLALARASVLLGRTVEASTLLDETQRIVLSVPDAVGITEQITEIRRTLNAGRHQFGGSANGFGPAALTTAELRVLQYLPTHLTVGEIAERLYLSRNTVKTHTITIYRKLGTSSRSGAVDIARAAGLLD